MGDARRPVPPQSTASTPPRFDPAQYAASLRGRAPALLGRAANGIPAYVHYDGCEPRTVSALHRFRLIAGGTERRIIVKVISPRPGDLKEPGNGGAGRPRRAPIPSAARKLFLESEALAALARHLDAVGNPRFVPVRVLEVLPAYNALAMVELGWPTLRDRFLSYARRPFANPGEPAEATRTAGAWLRAYHQCPRPSHTEDADVDWASTVEAIVRRCAYLTRRGVSASDTGRAVRRAAHHANLASEEAPAVGLIHGDYAMRNILVSPEGSVAGLDTGALWWGATCEDVAHFLVAMRLTAVGTPRSLAGRRLQWLERFERAFLAGYYGDEPAPIHAIALFELQAILDKWCSLEEDARRRDPIHAYPGRLLRLALMRGLFRRWLAGPRARS